MSFSWRRWKLGFWVALVLSLLVAGSTYAAGGNLKAVIGAFCASMLTNFGAFLTNHPVDQVSFDTEQITRGPLGPAGQGDLSEPPTKKV